MGSFETAASGDEVKFDCSGFEREGSKTIYREATEVAREAESCQRRVETGR